MEKYKDILPQAHEVHLPVRLTPTELEMMKEVYASLDMQVDNIFKVKRLGGDRGFIIEGLK